MKEQFGDGREQKNLIVENKGHSFKRVANYSKFLYLILITGRYVENFAKTSITSMKMFLGSKKDKRDYNQETLENFRSLYLLSFRISESRF